MCILAQKVGLHMAKLCQICLIRSIRGDTKATFECVFHFLHTKFVPFLVSLSSFQRIPGVTLFSLFMRKNYKRTTVLLNPHTRKKNSLQIISNSPKKRQIQLSQVSKISFGLILQHGTQLEYCGILMLTRVNLRTAHLPLLLSFSCN